MRYSIIVTTYNSGKYLRKCLDSIINQTEKDFTLIIVDDGSTDNTNEIIKPYLKNKNVKYYYKENGGVSDARNYGISKVKTPYFMFVDSDDYIASDLIETVSKYDNYDILSFKAIEVDRNYKKTKKLEKCVFELTNGQSYLLNLFSNRNYLFLVPWGFIYNTSFWKNNHFNYEKEYVHEDIWITTIVLLNSQKIISLDYYGYYYYQSEESITRSINDKKIDDSIEGVLHHYDLLINYINKSDYNKNFKREYKHYFAKYLLWYGSELTLEKRKEFVKKINKRKFLKNIISTRRLFFVKKILFKINYNLYYKLYFMVGKILHGNSK